MATLDSRSLVGVVILYVWIFHMDPTKLRESREKEPSAVFLIMWRFNVKDPHVQDHNTDQAARIESCHALRVKCSLPKSPSHDSANSHNLRKSPYRSPWGQ